MLGASTAAGRRESGAVTALHLCRRDRGHPAGEGDPDASRPEQPGQSGAEQVSSPYALD
jgi:hypothetical protein